MKPILALLLPLVLAAPSAPRATVPAEPGLLERIRLLGASVTDGFGLDLELEAPAGLELFVESALRAPHGEVRSFSNGMFFRDPLSVGAAQVDQALAQDATLVLALDFLFWYGYGTAPEAARPDRFEKGLAQLDRFECALVVADLPDMSPALQGSSPLMGGAPLISRSQIPSEETLAALNARLREWAAERPRVVVLPLADFVRRMRADEELRVAGQTIPAGAGSALLQSDLLHATVEGTAVFTLLALDALRAARADFPADAFQGTTDLVVAGVWDGTEAAREKRRERERKREERRKGREDEQREHEGAGGGLLLLGAR